MQPLGKGALRREAQRRRRIVQRGHGRTAFSVGRGAFDADYSLANGLYE